APELEPGADAVVADELALRLPGRGVVAVVDHDLEVVAEGGVLVERGVDVLAAPLAAAVDDDALLVGDGRLARAVASRGVDLVAGDCRAADGQQTGRGDDGQGAGEAAAG